MESLDPKLPRAMVVYDAAAPWDSLRSGTTVPTETNEPGISFFRLATVGSKGPPMVHPRSDFGDSIRPNVLANALRGSPDDGFEPLRGLYRATVRVLRVADGRILPLDRLQNALSTVAGANSALVDDVLRMMGSMGVLLIEAQGGGFRVGFAKSFEDGYRRRDYLATFTSELQAKSRRIDLLIGHSGTVGSYREELLRGLLRQLLPRRYEATTGFIEGCPRQLDIIVWDVENYAPLFREHNFVVVPLASVRAVIEVKTTLTRNTLLKGMEILWSTFRNRPTVLPVFKGIFAFEDGLGSSARVAAAMRRFYRGADEVEALTHRHGYYWAGVNGVCVPANYLVRERYRPGGGSDYPQPMLTGVADPVGGDAYSAMFLGVLLSHLEISTAAKLQNDATFRPVLTALDEQDFGPIYTDWEPSLMPAGQAAILDPVGAKAYVDQVHDFRAGRLEGHFVGKTRPSRSGTTSVGSSQRNDLRKPSEG